MRSLIVFITLTLMSPVAHCQDIDVPYDEDAYHHLDRWRILTSNAGGWHSGLREYDRRDVRNLLDSVGHVRSLGYDQYWADYFGHLTKSNHSGTNKPTPAPATVKQKSTFWRHFYTNPVFLFSRYGKDYTFQLNPLVSFEVGRSSLRDGLIIRNTRGLRLTGSLDNTFFFYTDIVETQQRFPLYVDQYIEDHEAIPRNGFYKPFESTLLNLDDGYDFLNSTGYLSVRVSDHVGFQIGHGRHFIGHGRRSMLLGNFANNAFYLQADWKFWKIHYRNIWSELRPRSAVFGGNDDVLPRKYSATHHLSFNILPTLNIGLFETVIFHRSNQLELGYLNPVILYRTVEQSANSPDNVMIGFDLHWDIRNTLSIYGQILFDEFKLDELILDNRGWWGNKYAIQLGALYVNAMGLPGLDVRVEYNLARPYTYTHRDSSASYSHYNLPLAHPLGANFKEVIIEARYPLSSNLILEGGVVNYLKGVDPPGENWGGNILVSHDNRVMDYNNKIGQGSKESVFLGHLGLSYTIFYGLFADAMVMYRSSDLAGNDELIYNFGVRYNLQRQSFRF